MSGYLVEHGGVGYDVRFFKVWRFPRKRNEPEFTGPQDAALYEIREEAEYYQRLLEDEDGRYCRVVDAAPHLDAP